MQHPMKDLQLYLCTLKMDNTMENTQTLDYDIDLDNMSDGDKRQYQDYLETDMDVPDAYHETIYDMLQKYRTNK